MVAFNNPYRRPYPITRNDCAFLRPPAPVAAPLAQGGQGRTSGDTMSTAAALVVLGLLGLAGVMLVAVGVAIGRWWL